MISTQQQHETNVGGFSFWLGSFKIFFSVTKLEDEQ